MNQPTRIAVIGLGYTGLPLALALAQHYPVLGFDIDKQKIDCLTAHQDPAGEISSDNLKKTTAIFSADPLDLFTADFFILCVPTPIDASNKPDLTLLEQATHQVGQALQPDAVVVFESTVYPGVTEDICVPILEAESGLVAQQSFFVGYSPERINPGDATKSITNVTKVVAALDHETTDLLAVVYGKINNGNIFRAKDIRTAEAAKVIENAQRDINIAFINEVSLIFHDMGIPSGPVLEAARTKWNFLPFTPGLVGGHCIGIDPYYLSYAAKENGYDPQVILAGRRTNDNMGVWIGKRLMSAFDLDRRHRILVLGLTFKENIRDLRNTRVMDLVTTLRQGGCHVDIHDACALPHEAKAHYDVDLVPDLTPTDPYDVVCLAVAHDAYKTLTADDLLTLVKPQGVVADIKGIWNHLDLPPSLKRWQL